METFGPYLRRMRALKGRTLEELAAHTRIDARYFQALEDEQFNRLPREVFVRGFVRAYARALGLDEAETFRLFDEAARPFYGPDDQEIQAQAAAAQRARARRRRRVAAWVGLVVTTGIMAVVIGLRSMRGSGASRQTEAPPHPTAESVEVSRPPGTDTVPPQSRAPEPLRLILEAVAPTWISVQIDRTLTKEALLFPGDRVEYEALDTFNVTTGNAGGLHGRLNGRPLPPFGQSGQVVRDLRISRGVSDAGAGAGR